MNIQASQSSIQSSEQYRIRANKQEQQAQQIQQEQKIQELKAVDEYDKNNPVGEEVEGIYSVSHDEEGNLKVNYTQPASKSESTQKTESSSSDQKAESKPSSSPVQSSESSSSSSSDNDDEIEELEKQKSALQQKLSRESDEALKAQIRNQIQAVEAEIIQLKTTA
ncbi:MAG: hypothetical protein IJ697_04725 [Synergistaceae bacterium]|nr:hypothetical protein [Synergistaceae bacterium]